MSSGSSQSPAQTTQTSDPWVGAQPALSQLYSSANQLILNDQGYQAYPNSLQTPLNPTLAQGLGAMHNIAAGELGGSVGVNAARGLGLNMINQGGLTPEQRSAAQQMQGVAGGFGDVASEAAGQQNPYLLSQIEQNNRRISDKIGSSMSGAGRYGSGQYTDVMARAMAEAANPVLAQDYAQRQQTRLAGLGGQQGALAGMSGIYGGGTENAGRWAQLIPGLDEARYTPSQRIQEYGKFFQDRSAQDLANSVAQWNAAQARPWEQMARFGNVLTGAGGLGGTKVTTANPFQPSALARAGGGALAGASLGSLAGPWGAGIGGIGGGLLGLLG